MGGPYHLLGAFLTSFHEDRESRVGWRKLKKHIRPTCRCNSPGATRDLWIPANSNLLSGLQLFDPLRDLI